MASNTINIDIKTNLVTVSATAFFFDDLGGSELAFCTLLGALAFAGFAATFTCVLDD